jgi:hypothetical protein
MKTLKYGNCCLTFLSFISEAVMLSMLKSFIAIFVCRPTLSTVVGFQQLSGYLRGYGSMDFMDSLLSLRVSGQALCHESETRGGETQTEQSGVNIDGKHS